MKKGLVLEGGGAKGAFQCGAIKALYDNGYTFDGVAGTSIGAINAAILAQDGNYQTLYDMWMNVSASDICDLDNLEVTKLLSKEFSKKSTIYWAKKLVEVVRHGGICSQKTNDFLKKYIDEEKVRNSSMDLAVVTYCISDRQPLEIFKKDIPEGYLVDYIFASAHFPAFKIKRYFDGKIYIDGGVYNNMPANVLIANGYDDIIAIRTMSKMPHVKVDSSEINIKYICPSENLGRMANVHRNSINNNIKLGYYDALKLIKNLKGYKYYVDGDLSVINEIAKKFVTSNANKLAKILNIHGDNLETKFIEEVSYVYDLPKSTLVDILLYLLEICAKQYKVEKYRIYTESEFLNAIFDKIDKSKKTLSEKIQIKRHKKEYVDILELILGALKEKNYE